MLVGPAQIMTANVTEFSWQRTRSYFAYLQTDMPIVVNTASMSIFCIYFIYNRLHIFRRFYLPNNIFCRQKHWVKHLIRMLLCCNKLLLAHQSDGYSTKNTLTLQQKHNSKASLTSCVHPPCLVFSSRLHILKGHFEGQIWAKKSTNAHSVLLRWFNTSHPDKWTTHISPF